MRRLLKIVAWAVAGMLSLLVAGAFVLYFLVPKDKIIARVVPAVEGALGRAVHLGDAGVSFWPPFGLYLAGLRVENLDTTSNSNLLEIDRLRAQLAFQPLLSGELRFSSVVITGLAFHYEQFGDSTSNLSDLLAGEGGVWPVVAEELEFENLQISMAQRKDTSEWSISGVHLQLSLDPVRLGFECALSVPQVGVRHGQDDTTYLGPLEMAASGTFQKNPFLLHVEEITGFLRDLPWRGAADISKTPAVATVDGHLTLGPATVKQVLAHLPPTRRAALSGYDFSGDLQLSFTARGPFDSLALGAARAEISWTQGRISDSLGELLSFSALSIPVDYSGFHLDADQVVSRYGPLHLAAVGSWPPEGRLELSVSGRTNVSTLVRQGTGTASGAVTWSASASGPLDNPAQWRLGARAQASQVSFEESGRSAFTVENAELSYDGASLRLERLLASYGGSDLKLEGEVQGLSWADFMADRPLSPAAALHVQSRRLNLDELFPDLAGDSAAPADTSARPPIPPIRASLSADFDTLMLGGAVWRRMHGEFRLEDGGCVIDTLYGSVFGGRVHLAGSIDSVASELSPYEFRILADSLEIGDLLGRFGAAGRHLRGRSDLSAHLSGRGAGTQAVAQQLVLDGSVQLFDARLEKLDAAVKIQQLLGLKVQDPIPIKSVANRFRFENGRTRTDDFHFNTPQGAWVMGGTAGQDGTLDYALSGRLPPEVASHLALPDSWFSALPADWQGKVDPLDLLKDDQGAIDLFLKIGGTLRSPEVAVDWEKLQPLFKQRFEARLKQKLTDEAQKQLKEGLKGLFDKLKR